MSTEINNDVSVEGRAVVLGSPDYMTCAPPVISRYDINMASGCYNLETMALGQDGLIYIAPVDAGRSMMSINPVTRSVRRIVHAQGRLITGMCTNPVNGLIYMLDYNGGWVSTFNPVTDEYTSQVVSQGGLSNCVGLVLHPNGKMYAIPTTTGAVGVIDPSDNTWSTFSTGVPATPGYMGGVLAPNGKIYCSPYGSTNVGIIDTTVPSMDATTITGILGGSNYKYYTGALAPNGKIYYAPRSSDRVLIIDPSNDTVSYITSGVPAGINKYGSCTLAPDGKIYAPPINRTDVMIIDPETDTVNVSTITGLNSIQWKHFFSCLGPNGRIYCANHNTGHAVLEITPGIPKLPLAPLLTPYVNGS